MWHDLKTEIEEQFAILVGCVDVHAIRLNGFRTWNPDARAELERNRRAYKTEKQRVYTARKRGDRSCPSCGGALGRPYRERATCQACGCEVYVPSSSAVKKAA